MAGFLGFLHQLDDAPRPRRKRLPIGDLRDDVVVIRVEPLGHLQRGAVSIAAGQREFLVEGDLRGVAAQRTDGQRRFQHLVVVGHVRRDGVVRAQAELF